MQRIVVIGGKGTAINVAESVADAADRFGHPVELLGFAIDDPALGSAINGFPILWRNARDTSAVRRPKREGHLLPLQTELMQERVALLHSLQIPSADSRPSSIRSAYVATARISDMALSSWRMPRFNLT